MLPTNVSSGTDSTIRNARNIDIDDCRTELFASSFISPLPVKPKGTFVYTLSVCQSIRKFDSPPVRPSVSVFQTFFLNACRY